MAEYNPSKIIKDGNTYNFRDTTKIPLAGSNEISGSLIPSTDGTVNLGSSSYQWNNAYIKSLTINGVACGDILTHNASEFVDLSSEQIISGLKKFSNVLVGIDDFNLQSGGDWDAGARLTLNKKTESASAILQTFSNTDNSAYVYDVNNFYPYSNNKNGLGTSTNKWKTINGINPGVLSFPNCGEGVNVTSQVVNTDGIFQYTNNLYDGLLVVTAFADTAQIANQAFECRAVRSTDNAVTAHIPLRLNEKAAMRFANFTNFAYVELFKVLGNV